MLLINNVCFQCFRFGFLLFCFIFRVSSAFVHSIFPLWNRRSSAIHIFTTKTNIGCLVFWRTSARLISYETLISIPMMHVEITCLFWYEMNKQRSSSNNEWLQYKLVVNWTNVPASVQLWNLEICTKNVITWPTWWWKSPYNWIKYPISMHISAWLKK